MSKITEYNKTVAELAKLKEKFAGATYEVATTAGMEAARRDRRELVTLRTDLEKKRIEIKAPALERCKQIDAEARRITAEIEALEKPIDDQIKAEEAKKEAIRIEKERQAAAAQKILDDKIIEIGKLPLRCIGKTAEEIQLFLATLEARPFGGEFTGVTLERAEMAKAEAIAEIKAALVATIEAEEREAILKAEREAEEARQAELAAERERQAAIEREEIEKQQRANAIEAERLRVLAEAEEARQAEARRIEQEAAEKLRKEQEAIEAARREEERQAAIKAEAARKEAEKKAKLAEAKCKDAATAFKRILDISQCNNTELHVIQAALAEIAVIAEANI